MSEESTYTVSDFISDELANHKSLIITLANGGSITAIKPDPSVIEDAGVKEKDINSIEGYLTLYTSNDEYLYINENAIVSIERDGEHFGAVII
ncbi:MAG: hypothetical protein ACRCZW_15385 [Lactobacillaceae bacterium]